MNNSARALRIESLEVRRLLTVDPAWLGVVAPGKPIGQGDVDGNGTIDLTEFGGLKDKFGDSVPFGDPSDFDFSGSINLTDFGILKARFGDDTGLTRMEWKGSTVVAVEGEWIVTLKNEVAADYKSLEDATQQLGDKQIQVLAGLGGRGRLAVSIPVTTAKAVSEFFATSQVVETFEPNALVRSASFVPMDELFGEQWALENDGKPVGTVDADIDATAAWNRTLGSPTVVVAVVDSGIDFGHQDLSKNIWASSSEIALNGLDDDGNGFVDDWRGVDFIELDSDANDSLGHGTHLAGIVAASADSVGVVGVASLTRVMAVRVLDSWGNGSIASVVAGIRYVTMMRERGVPVQAINASWGSEFASSELSAAVVESGQAGLLIVAAAGNRGSSVPMFPASFDHPNIVSVGASDVNDQLAGFSNFGKSNVDLVAPGVEVLSTWRGNEYRYLSGTSMAAPHVAGVAALLWAVRPQATVEEVRDAIFESVDKHEWLEPVVATGGRLNAAQALAVLTDGESITCVGDVIDGITITKLSSPSIDDKGNVIFKVEYLGGEAITNGKTLLFKTGDVVDGGTLGATLQTHPFLSESGVLVFRSSFSDGLESIIVVRDGVADRAVTQGDVIDGVTMTGIGNATVAKDGKLAFRVGFAGGEGIVVGDQLIVRLGDVIDGQVVLGVGPPAIDDTGNVAFYAELTLGRALLNRDLEIITQVGDSIEVTPITRIGDSLAVSRPDVTPAGSVFFSIAFLGGEAIVSLDKIILKTGDYVDGYVVSDFKKNDFRGFDVEDQDRWAGVIISGDTEILAVNRHAVLKAGDAFGEDGKIIAGFRDPRMNDSGQVVVLVDFVDGDSCVVALEA